MKTQAIKKKDLKHIYNVLCEDCKLKIGEYAVVKIKTFDDACIECGTTEKEFNDKFSNVGLPLNIISSMKLEIIAKALNGEWIPNWEDSTECKFYPFFKMSPFGFGGSGYVDWIAFSFTGSRLCFKSKELAKYAGKQFEDIYRSYII